MIYPKSIIFDLDGTLVDTAPDLACSLNHLLTRDGLEPVSVETIRHLVGEGGRRLIERGYSERGQHLTQADIERLFIDYIAHYGAHLAVESRLFPGARDCVETLLAAGSRCAICTNKPEHLSLQLIEAFDLRASFPIIIGADSCAERKPSPLPLQEAIAGIGGDGRDAVLIGDSHTDIATARAANIPIIGVSFGYSATPLRAKEVDALIDSYSALPLALTQLKTQLIDHVER